MERGELEAKGAFSVNWIENARGQPATPRSRRAFHLLAPRRDWEIVMLQGPRARRLREVADRGEALGLFHVRPVWLVNPEMVSRVFPLRQGCLIWWYSDEDHSYRLNVLTGTLRAKRVVVSGDEKQLPHLAFF